MCNSNFLKLLLILTFLLSCSSCLKNTEVIKYKDTLTIGVDITIGEITPFSSTALAGGLSDLLYNSLFVLGSEGELINLLANRIILEDDGARVRIFLKEVHAKDVKQSFEKAKVLKSSLFKPFLANLLSIDIISENEIVFNLKNYDRVFLAYLSEIPIVSFSKEDPTTGAFHLLEQTKDYALFKRKQLGSAGPDLIKVARVSNYNQAVKHTIKGELDLLLFVSPGDYKFIDNVPELIFRKLSTRFLYSLLGNQKNKGARVDFARLSKKIDREKFSKIYGSSFSSMAFIPVPSDSAWFDFDLKNSYLFEKYFQTTPRMEELAVNLSFSGFQHQHERAANFLKNSLREEGLNIDLHPVPHKDFYEKILADRNFELLFMPLNFKEPFLTAYNVFYSTGILNIYNYKNIKVDYYLDQTRSAQDFNVAKVYFNLAIKELIKAPPGVFLFWTDTPIVYRKGCINVPSNTAGLFIKLAEVRCSQVEKKPMLAGDKDQSNDRANFLKLFLAFIILLPLYHFLTSPKRMLKKMVGDRWPK